RVHEGNREITIEADIVGEKTSHELIEQALSKDGLDMEWELSRTLFTFPEATITDPPARSRTNDEAFADTSVGLESKGVQLSQP
ncbi:MAG: hypothetical protein ACOCUA_03030, partial [archaeon]